MNYINHHVQSHIQMIFKDTARFVTVKSYGLEKDTFAPFAIIPYAHIHIAEDITAFGKITNTVIKNFIKL